jgi:uncharacterized protein (TIGR00251 family)
LYEPGFGRAIFFSRPVLTDWVPVTGAEPDGWPCLKSSADGCELLVQVVPNAGRTGCAGLHDGALRVRLAAAPIDGRANVALVQWLAQSLGLPRRAVCLISGDSARRKRLHIGCERERVDRWLQTQLAGTDSR